MKKTSTLFVAALFATPAFAQGGDDCSIPTAIGATGTVTFDTTAATTSGFNGGGSCVVGADTINQDLFWQFTVPTTGDYIFDTFGSSYDTKLSVHSGAACAATCSGYNDDTGGLQSEVQLVGLTAGDQILVQVGGFGTSFGFGQLNITQFVAPPVPGNDTCATPDTTTLVGLGSFAFDTTGALTSGFDGGGTCAVGSDTNNQDIFYTWTAPSAGDFVIDTTGTSHDTKLSVHSGVDCSATCLGYNDDANGTLQSEVRLLGVTAGEQFLVQVGGFGAAFGPGTLTIGVFVDPCLGTVDDSFEDNDLCTAPSPIMASFNTGLFASLTDADFYEITLQPNEVLDVTIFDTANEDLDLRLYDDTCALITDFNTDGFSTSTVGAAGPVTFVFEIYVDPLFFGNGCLNYDMDVVVSADPCAGIMPDGFEDNDDCTTATPLGDGTYTGLNIIGDDNDFFSVSVADGATIQADIFFISPDGDLDLYLWDPLVACDSSLVGEGTGSGALSVGFSVSDDEFVTYTNTTGAAQDLIIEARKWSGDTANSCNTYDLQITGSAGPGGGGVGTNYCTANVNSTGVTGVIGATGSRVASVNDLTLTGSNLPTQAFAFFLVSSTQGFVPNPGGSEGNLCLGGAIGRYVGAGQIQQSDLAGEIALTLDLTMVPQPTGFVSIMATETWNFQAWYRDAAMGGGATSNFTDGLQIDFL